MDDLNLNLPELVEDTGLVTAPVETGLSWWWYVALAVALVAILVPLYFAFRPRRKGAAGEVKAPKVDPSILANQRLQALRQQLPDMSHREAAIELASILRDYVADRFEIRAPYQTTGEFIRNLGIAEHFPPEQRESVVSLLQTTDLVKFATWILDHGSIGQWIDYTEDFVRNSRPPAEPATQEKPRG